MTRGSIIASLSPDAQAQIRKQLAPKQNKEEKRPKYNNASVVYDGLRFPSKKEGLRWLVLKGRQQRGEISDLKYQPAWRIEINGMLICDYVADASYIEADRLVVEDTKSKFTKTAEYRLKQKLMRAVHFIDVVEV